jgi:hypothetical protein
MPCDHEWQEAGTSKRPDWACSKCKALYSVLNAPKQDQVLAWYDPSNGAVDTDKRSSRFTKAGQLWPLGRI